MNKAATLLLFLAFASLRSQAQQPVANSTTLPLQLYTAGQYITIPVTAFGGTAPAGKTLTQLFFSQAPENAEAIRIKLEGSTIWNVYTPAGVVGQQISTTPAGRPQATIEVKPEPPSGTTDTVRIYYRLYANNTVGGGGSVQSNTGCIFIPITTVPLNVTLTRFAGEAKGSASMLQWSTSSEENLRGFEMEWSTNLTEWKTAGSIAGEGAGSNYQWSHESPAGGANYYRLRSVSLGGTATLSAVVRVDHSRRAAAIAATPNPARNFLRIEGPEGSVASLVDMGGKEVARIQVSAASTMNVQHLASGMYQLTLRGASGSVLAQERVVVRP